MRAARWCAWILIPALWAGSLRAATPPARAGAHCAGAEAGSLAAPGGHGSAFTETGLAPSEGTQAATGGVGVRAQHHCPGCQPGHCPDMAHCLTAGQLAAASGVPGFGLAAPLTSDRSSPDDRPLSANPTPPIPPPQPAL